MRYESGIPDTSHVLVLGDSQARHLCYGFQDAVVPNGVNDDIANTSACLPLFGLSLLTQCNEQECYFRDPGPAIFSIATITT